MALIRCLNGVDLTALTFESINQGENTNPTSGSFTLSKDYKYVIVSSGGTAGYGTITYTGSGTLDFSTNAYGSSAGTGYTSIGTRTHIYKDCKTGDSITIDLAFSQGGYTLIGVN